MQFSSCTETTATVCQSICAPPSPPFIFIPLLLLFLPALLTEDNEVRSDGRSVSVHFHPAPIKASDKVSVFNIIIIPSPVIKSQKNFYAVFADRQTSRPLLTPPLQPVHFRANTGKSNWEKVLFYSSIWWSSRGLAVRDKVCVSAAVSSQARHILDSYTHSTWMFVVVSRGPMTLASLTTSHCKSE